MPFYLLLMSFLFAGCANELVVQNRGCTNKGATFGQGDNSQVLYRSGVWHSSHRKDGSVVQINDLLQENKLNCNEVRDLSYSVEQGLLDTVLSFVPLYRRVTVEVRGKKILTK